MQLVQQTFLKIYAVGALLCGLALGGWLLLVMKVQVRRWFVPALAVLLVADLLWFAYGRSAQCDPELYYPPIPALDAIAKATPGRVIGVGCFPAELAIMRTCTTFAATTASIRCVSPSCWTLRPTRDIPRTRML